MVFEMLILARVQHFKEGCARISSTVSSELVYLIEKEDRVGCFDLNKALNENTGH